MGSLKLAPVPNSLKPIAHYLKIATEHENRDPVVAYWARIHALEVGMKMDKKSKEALALLLPLMDWLEAEKKVLAEREEVTSNVVANAYLENYAIKVIQREG
uniref:Vacuolar protein sorting-associated protein VTA1 homolog n=1 Tax=Caligus rogercresseyi TaxID=217165 RepID=C1BRM5_CALRO|nr:Vacuolar protein sorting-associated protein VTA1 homolog [Caligus rogercresseyi]